MSGKPAVVAKYSNTAPKAQATNTLRKETVLGALSVLALRKTVVSDLLLRTANNMIKKEPERKQTCVLYLERDIQKQNSLFCNKDAHGRQRDLQSLVGASYNLHRNSTW